METVKQAIATTIVEIIAIMNASPLEYDSSELLDKLSNTMSSKTHKNKDIAEPTPSKLPNQAKRLRSNRNAAETTQIKITKTQTVHVNVVS
jgi:hypothetical protein